jgi:hypothetical protein
MLVTKYQNYRSGYNLDFFGFKTTFETFFGVNITYSNSFNSPSIQNTKKCFQKIGF